MNASLRRLRFGWALAMFLATLPGGGWLALAEQPPSAAESPKAGEPAASAAAPATTKVVRGTLKIETTLEGVFEAKDMSEIILRPKEWSDWTVLSAVPHGARVAQGDLLVAFDTEKIDHAIADLRYELRTGNLALQQAEQDLRTAESLTPLDLAASDRALRVAEEDARLYFEIGKPQAVKSAEFMLKMSKERLEYQEEEFRQLEKMYKADDLTEETEKIVLKRAQDAVEQARFAYNNAKIDHDQTLKFAIPREEEHVKDATRRAKAAAEKNRIALPVALDKQRMDLEKLKVKRSRDEQRLAEMLADREQMQIKSPINGVLYYGSCRRGKWSGNSDELRRGSTVLANKPFLTVVEPRPMSIHTSVTEKQYANVRAGQQGDAAPTAFPDRKVKAVVESLGNVPLDGSSFDCRLTLATNDPMDGVMPGMNCEVRLVPLEKAGVLLAPASAVAADESEEGKFYACRIGPDGQPQKTTVTIGKRNPRQVEILSGVSEGDQVVTEVAKEKQ